MPQHSVKVGNVELVSVSDGYPTRSPFMPFPDTTIIDSLASRVA